MNRRDLLKSIPTGAIFMLAGNALASASNEALKLAAMPYPYNKFTLHRVQVDEFGLQVAGPEDSELYVLRKVVEAKASYTDFSEHSFVVMRDGQPIELLTSRQVIMVPRRKHEQG